MTNYHIKQSPSVRPTTKPRESARNQNAAKTGAQEAFQSVLDGQVQRQQKVVFSKHATERLMQRNIRLTQQEMTRLSNGLDRAAQKGIRETLIVMDDRAFIASVNNKTVITAAVDDQLKDQVFSNIDGAVIV